MKRVIVMTVAILMTMLACGQATPVPEVKQPAPVAPAPVRNLLKEKANDLTAEGYRFRYTEGGYEYWTSNNSMLARFEELEYIGFVIDAEIVTDGSEGEDMVYIAYEFGVPMATIEAVIDVMLEGDVTRDHSGVVAGWDYGVATDLDDMLISIGFGNW